MSPPQVEAARDLIERADLAPLEVGETAAKSLDRFRIVHHVERFDDAVVQLRRNYRESGLPTVSHADHGLGTLLQLTVDPREPLSHGHQWHLGHVFLRTTKRTHSSTVHVRRQRG